MNAVLYIGPLIERGGKFAYDTFSAQDGLRSSFRYPRIEQARHDRRAIIAESCSGTRYDVRICETLAEFERAVAGHGEPTHDGTRLVET